MTVSINKPVPDFSGAATSETTFRLSEHRDKHNVVLYFYSKDSTPGCTTEGQNFRDLHDEFLANDTVIFGISRDTMRRHENFKAKQEFPFELISDESEEICNLFDIIKLKKLYGKEYMGIVRSTFLINKQGILTHEWRNLKVKGHAAEVLEACQGI